MTLQEFCKTLPETDQIRLAVTFSRTALPIWNEYARSHKLVYRDSVVGIDHKIPRQLLEDTIKEVEVILSLPRLVRVLKRKTKLMKLYWLYSDPVIALWDTDWELPEEVKKTFYSVYNLAGYFVDKSKNNLEESLLYISINQAIDAIQTIGLLSDEQIKAIIEQGMKVKS